ncbi:MAG TPA: hypothetical protein VJ647_04140 [Chitinophagaceae bacterium]|nr:hypothetical protein [Chitinophagaceae bacterium]
MLLKEVTDKKTEKEFHEVNVLINRHDPNYIRPLIQDVQAVFDPKKNKAFRNGEAVRWVLKNESGDLVGRIAAFVNKKYKTKGDDGPVGGLGFFECIDSQEAADMLFDVGKHWLLQRGMTAMDGPINFGERERWWGLLVDGFIPPLYCMNYNPSYYRKLWENYGFKPFFHQYCYGLDARKRLPEKLYRRHADVEHDPAFSARHIRKNQLSTFAADFTEIYNKAWAGHGGLKQMKKDQVLAMFNTMKPVMDEKIVWFAYHEEQPVAFFVNIPDLNQWFRHLNGRFDWLGKLKFLWLKATRRCTKFNGLVFGVVPEFQGKGLDAYIIIEAARVIQPQTAYTDYELQWIGDFNPVMINVARSIGETFQTRELITYRYLFDRTAAFKRHPIL